MKTLLGFLLLCAAVVSAAGAQGPAFVEPPRLAAATILPVYDDKGVLTSFNVTVKFAGDSLLPAGKKKPRVITVEFDLVELGKQTVNVDGVVSDYDDIAAEFVAVCLKQYFIAHPLPLPKRKALRSPPPPTDP